MASASLGPWLWVPTGLLVAIVCYGLGRSLFGLRPSLAASTTLAVAASVTTAVLLCLFGYFIIPLPLLRHFGWFAPLASVALFASILGRHIRRVHPKPLMAGVAALVGLATMGAFELVLLNVIGCHFGDCINL